MNPSVASVKAEGKTATFRPFVDLQNPRPTPSGASVFPQPEAPTSSRGGAERLPSLAMWAANLHRGRVGMDEQERTVRIWETAGVFHK